MKHLGQAMTSAHARRAFVVSAALAICCSSACGTHSSSLDDAVNAGDAGATDSGSGGSAHDGPNHRRDASVGQDEGDGHHPGKPAKDAGRELVDASAPQDASALLDGATLDAGLDAGPNTGADAAAVLDASSVADAGDASASTDDAGDDDASSR